MNDEGSIKNGVGCKFANNADLFDIFIINMLNDIDDREYEAYMIFEEVPIDGANEIDTIKEEEETPQEAFMPRHNVNVCDFSGPPNGRDDHELEDNQKKIPSPGCEEGAGERLVYCKGYIPAATAASELAAGAHTKVATQATEPVEDEFLISDGYDDGLNDLVSDILVFGEDANDKDISIVHKLRKKIAGMVKIRKGLTVDSGAADHVMPIGWLIMFMVMKSIGQIRGLCYVAANGSRIPNAGEQHVRFMTLDGTWTELVFQLAGINKPLISVSKLIEAGYRVVFDEENSYIMHKKTRKIIKMTKERGVFVIDAYVQKSPDAGFTRPR